MLDKRLLSMYINSRKLDQRSDQTNNNRPEGQGETAMKKNIINVEKVTHVAAATAWMVPSDSVRAIMQDNDSKVFDIGISFKRGTAYFVKWGSNVTEETIEKGKTYLKTETSDFMFEVVTSIKM